MGLITRRCFLALLSSLPLAVDAKMPAWQQFLQKNRTWQPDWQYLINQLIGPYSSVVKVGHASLSSLPNENSQWSEQYIIRLTKAANEMGNEEIAIFSEIYRCRLRQDFQQGRTVQLNGYILSRTEVEICRWVATTIDTSFRGK